MVKKDLLNYLIEAMDDIKDPNYKTEFESRLI